MTFLEYQTEALKTAKFKDGHALPYLRLGLISEVGEVAGKIKKWIRDQDADPVLLPREAIADELGDVLWYVAVLAHYEKIDVEDWDVGYSFRNRNDTVSPVFDSVTAYSEFLAEKVSSYTVSVFTERHLLNVFSACSFFVVNPDLNLGFTLQDIMTRNISKLRSRQERGVIGGSGDNR